MSDDLRKLAENLAGATFQQYARAVLKIEDNMGQLIPFELNDAQRIVYREIKRQEDAGRPVRILILKGRRQGMSTLTQMRILWRMLTTPGLRAHTVAHNLALTHELYDKWSRGIKSMPELLRPTFDPGGDKGRRQKFEDIPNPVPGEPPIPGPQYRADSAHDPEAVGRGTGVMIAHYTEVPQWKKPAETMQSLRSTVPDKPGTEIYVETTAKGATGWFYDTWIESQRQIAQGIEPLWIPVFVPWFETREYARDRRSGEPGLTRGEQAFKKQYGLTNRQVYWYRDQRLEYGDSVVEEFPSCWEEAFLHSGRPYFTPDSLDFYKSMSKQREPLKKGQFKVYPGTGKGAFHKDEWGPTHIYAQPVPDHRYVVGIDFAGGRAKDNSAIVVMDVDTREVVATHQSKFLPDDVLIEAIFLGRTYNTAQLVPERNGIGQALVDRLVNEYAYPNVYRDVDKTQVRRKRGTRFGWHTGPSSRKWLLEEMASLVHKRAIQIPCFRIVDEMHSFIYTDEEGQHAAAEEGRRDDMVLALAIAIRGFASVPAFNPKKVTPRHRPAISGRAGY